MGKEKVLEDGSIWESRGSDPLNNFFFQLIKLFLYLLKF